MDFIAKITTALVSFAEGLSPQTIQFWLHLVCLLTLPIAACAWTFRRGYRSVFIQIMAGVFGALVALSLPLQHIQIHNGMARLWFLTFALLVVSFIPVILPSLLLPTLGSQQRLRKVLWYAIGTLIFANLLWGKS